MHELQRENLTRVTRRQLFGSAASGIGVAALSSLTQRESNAAESAMHALGLPGLPHFAPKAKRVIVFWQGGGPSHVDLFDQKGRKPATIVVVRIAEIYSQCARALMRADLWSGRDESEGLPTVGQILSAMTDGTVGGAAYDDAWHDRASKTMW